MSRGVDGEDDDRFSRLNWQFWTERVSEFSLHFESDNGSTGDNAARRDDSDDDGRVQW